MLEFLKNRILIASCYGLYSAFIVFFFDSFSFVASSGGSIYSYLSLIALLTLAEFGLLEWVSFRMKNAKKYRFLFVVSFLISGLFSSFLIWLLFRSPQSSLALFLTTFLVGALLPTMVVILSIIFDEAKNKIANLPENEILNNADDQAMFYLENEAGKLLLKLPIKDLICFEANDNYVIIYYLDKNDKVKKLMERFSLKKMEKILALKKVYFERVHKSFLINANYLVAISGKAQAYKLELFGMENLIPVSRSYSINALELRLKDKN